MTRTLRTAFLVLLVLGGSLPAPGRAAGVLPSNFYDSLVNGNADLNKPTAMAFSPDGRLFVCEQGGTLRIIKDNSLLAAPFLTIPPATTNSSGERGLLGVAFDPDFASNRYLYVYATHVEPSASVTFEGAVTVSGPVTYNRISRFTADALNPDQVQAGSEVVLLNINPLTATNHNGGALHFGPDGKLYFAAGENAVMANSQSMGNLLGKISRINSDGSIPTDNPFYGTASGNNRAIYDLGLRNPFTFNFQPGTGRLFINDVGNMTWEEIDEGLPGLNFGWATTEGDFDTTAYPGFTLPAYTYNSAGSGPAPSDCAITGGTFYNPSTALFPAAYLGRYFFADYCSGWIRYLDTPLPSAGTTTGSSFGFATGYPAPVGLEVGPEGALYVLTGAALSTGRVYRIIYSSGPTATPTRTPTRTPTPVPGTPTRTPTPTPTASSGLLTISNPYPVPSFGGPIVLDLDYPGGYSLQWKVVTLGGLRIRRGSASPSGPYQLRWDMKDDWGGWAANGPYFLHLEVQAGGASLTKNFKVLVER